jgi:hypothetical protein
MQRLPVEIRDGKVDVAEVMGRIRERIRGRRDQGLYTDDEVDELYALKIQAFADEAEIDPDVLARLMAPNHNWNISPDYRIETHRAGWRGPRLGADRWTKRRRGRCSQPWRADN